jgi:hypothetical protein
MIASIFFTSWPPMPFQPLFDHLSLKSSMARRGLCQKEVAV